MLCSNCGSDNPSTNRFCGMCGTALTLPEPPVATEEAAAPEPEYRDESPEPSRRAEEPGISGPSFLGLSDAPPEDNEYSYLLEDEPRRGRAVASIVILLLLAAGILVALNRRAVHSYIARLNKPPASLYPNAADHSDTGVGADAKPVEPAIPQQQANDAPNPAPSASPAQPTASEEKNQAATLPQRAVDDNSNEPASKAAADDASALPPTTKPEGAPANSSFDAASAPPPASAALPAAATTISKKPAAARLTNKELRTADDRSQRFLVLGENYLWGRGGLVKNCDQAVVYLKAAAQAGNPQARSHLGAMYATGECVPLDRSMAYRWFTMARETDPNNPWYEHNLNMLWRDMSADERLRSGGPR